MSNTGKPSKRGAHQDYKRRLGRLIGMINYREWKTENLQLTTKQRSYLDAELSALNWAVMVIGEKNHEWYGEAIDEAQAFWEGQKKKLTNNLQRENRTNDNLESGTS